MVNRGAVREYVNGSLWVWPGISAVAALLVGFAVSVIDVAPGSPLAPLAFQGTADDARALLTIIAGTVVTVIALVLGLTVVALQLSSTQFSPRLLRKFLRDRANQVVLSVFVATFVYSSAGLYTVGLAAGARVEQFPRVAVSGAIVLLFASMAMVVYFADHLAHSIQIDAIGARVEKDTLAVVRSRLGGVVEDPAPPPPAWAVAIPARRSGYLQTVHPDHLLDWARRHRLVILLHVRVGEHVVAGTVLGWAWTVTADLPAVDPTDARSELDQSVRIGFERTLEQDAALGIRQLVDMACKALSPAVNDPYTAVQAVDHLSVIFGALAVRPLGDWVTADPGGAAVIVPGRRFPDYLATMCGLIRRYGSAEPTLSIALLRLLENCAAVLPADPARWSALAEQADLIVADATRTIAQPADLAAVTAAGAAFQERVRPHVDR
ncbi:MAG TPA: DUF2254 domain-containing protein [Nakamurella sp.]